MNVLTRYEIEIETNWLGIEPKTKEFEAAILSNLANFEVTRKGPPVRARATSAKYIQPTGLLPAKVDRGGNMANDEYCDAWLKKYRGQLTMGAISELWNEANFAARLRIEQLRGMGGWASGRLFDAGDIAGAKEIVRLAGDQVEWRLPICPLTRAPEKKTLTDKQIYEMNRILSGEPHEPTEFTSHTFEKDYILAPLEAYKSAPNYGTLRPNAAEITKGAIPTATANETQHGGTHYQGKPIQPWDFIVANGIPFLEGNAIKYLVRWRDKGGIEDLRKAQHYIQKLIEIETTKAGEQDDRPGGSGG